MYRHPRFRFGFLVVLAVLALTPAGVVADDRFLELESRVEQLRSEGGVPSLAVAVALGGRVVWESGFGLADVEAGVPATAATPYSIASVTKPLTATALMLLVERGLIALDRPINDYLAEPGLIAHVGDAREATVRRVASHTAGLPVHYHFFPEGGVERPSPAESRRRYGVLVHAPGERFVYSNFGYALLEHVIEGVSGSAYGEFLRREVFEPLGMDHSSVPVDGASVPDGAAARYDLQGARLPFYDFDHRGGSAVFASAHDLVRFGLFHVDALLDGQQPILSSASRLEMQAPSAAESSKTAYGLGWLVRETGSGHRVLSHSGAMAGVTSSLTLVPEAKLVVAVLANTSTDVVFEASDLIVQSLLPGFDGDSRTLSDDELRDGLPPRMKKSAPPKLVRGIWEGFVDTEEGRTPIRLQLGRRLDSRMWIGEDGPFVITDLKTAEDEISALVYGALPDGEAARQRHVLRLELTLRGERLTGVTTAVSSGSQGDLPRALSYWVELDWVELERTTLQTAQRD